MKRLVAAALLALPLAFAAGSQAGTPTPQLTALQYQEQQINNLKGQIRVLQANWNCLAGQTLGVIQITTVDNTPWLAVAPQDDSQAVYIPTVKSRCVS